MGILPESETAMIFSPLDSQGIPSAEYMMSDCSWCWQAEYPSIPFPENRSSTICGFHADWLLARRAAKRETIKTVNFILIDDPDELKPLPSYPFVNHKNRWPEYPRNWSRVSWLVRKASGNRCVWCGRTELLSTHHMGVPYITGKPGTRTDKHDLRLENLYPLCGSCHSWIEEQQRQEELRRLRKHRRLGVGTGMIVYEAR